MPRKVDVFAGDGSFAGKLRKRREHMEEGNPEAAAAEMTVPADGGEADGGSHDKPDYRYKRGYRSNQ